MRRALPWILVPILIVSGCGRSEGPGETPEPEIAADPTPTAEIAAEKPTILERPFTAEEIRAEWVPGLRLLLRRTTVEGSVVEKWTVLAADEEGVDIESVVVANDLNAEGEPSVNRSTWIELRDHASFPAASATREWVTQSTLLGELDGWLYRVYEEEQGSTQEFFFAASLPGAPVQMRILQGETTVFELEQTARLRPASE